MKRNRLHEKRQDDMQKKYEPIRLINVSLQFGEKPLLVGRLAAKDGSLYFEYDTDFLRHSIEISPFYLPIERGLKIFDRFLFEGLPGVFNDSLPDGWGRLLLDRALRAKQINPTSFSILDRLAHVGTLGMGALIYIPDFSEHYQNGEINLDKLATHAHEVLEGSPKNFFEELLALNGSSGGARPKAMIGVKSDKKSIIHGVDALDSTYEHWLVKFSNSIEGKDAGAIEYVYSEMAKLAGIEMTETFLFPSKNGAGYFATRRFDREGNNRLHLHTACGLLHSDFRTPSLDYKDLIKASLALTQDIREAKKMYRLATFNVLAYNRDDHAKNFSFIMNETGKWKLAPAYDLTFSAGPNGEQSTMVLGEGKNPSLQHLIELANTADINKNEAKEIIARTQSALNQWKNLASNAGVSKHRINDINKFLRHSNRD